MEHITVNGRRMNVPSFCVSVGDTVAIRPESRTSPLFANRAETAAELKTPAWLELSEGGLSATIASVPMTPATEAPFSAATVIQFYSR